MYGKGGIRLVLWIRKLRMPAHPEEVDAAEGLPAKAVGNGSTTRQHVVGSAGELILEESGIQSPTLRC